MHTKLTIPLVAVGVGIFCLAPVAQAEETAPDRTTTDDSNLSVATTIGDATSLGLDIDAPDAESLHLGAPISNLVDSVGYPNPQATVTLQVSDATVPTLRLCLTCRR